MITSKKLELVQGLAEAKGRQDVEDAMAFQHADMVLSAPPFGSVAQGHDANRNALAQFFAIFPDYTVTLAGNADDGETMTFWGLAHLTMNGALLGVESNGRRANIEVFIQFTFRDDLIASERFFFDLADLCAQSGVSTDAVRSLFFSVA